MEHTGRAWLDGLMRPLVRKVSSTLLDQFGGSSALPFPAAPPSAARSPARSAASAFPSFRLRHDGSEPDHRGQQPHAQSANTVGKPFNNVEVRLGEGDEIQIKGPSITRGYWNRPDATADALRKTAGSVRATWAASMNSAF